MSVSENAINFNTLEREVFKMCCVVGVDIIRDALHKYDAELAKSRDRKQYRHRGKRKSVLKTIMGSVDYHRSVYESNDEAGQKIYVYLLDDAIGVSDSGFMSGLLTEYIAQAVCQMPYRSAARTVSELTGQTLSHTAAWNVAQSLGESLDIAERNAAAQAKVHKGSGAVEVPVLFEEQDGIYLSLQGKDRKTYGARHEMKLAIAYSGAKQTGKKRYELTGKVACACFENVREFIERKEGAIAAVYNVSEIQLRILNGDGAAWIKRSADEDEGVRYQLDTFHRNRAIRESISDPEWQATIFELLYTKNIELLLQCLEAMSNSVDDEAEREKIRSLLTYFTNNKDGLIPYHRRGLALPPPKDGIVYRRCGAAESNIFTILGSRMKRGRASWSLGGGSNLARLLCLKATGKLCDALRRLPQLSLPEKYAEEIVTGLSPAKVPKSEGKGYNGFRRAAIPDAPSMKWLKDILSPAPLSDLPLR